MTSTHTVRVEGGSCTGTFAEVTEFLRWVGLTPEMQEFETAFEGGNLGSL